MQINVKVDDREVKEGFKKLQAKMGDLTPVMRDIGEIIITSIKRNFEQGGRPPWRESVRAKRDSGKTLSDTGRLKNSLTIRAFSNRVIVGTNVKYAAIHQFGGVIPARTIKPINARALLIPTKNGFIFRKSASIPATKMPARPFMLVQDEDWGIIKTAILKHLEVNK